VSPDEHLWAVVLPTADPAAAGTIPGQYYAPQRGEPLIWNAICRARRVVARARTCVVVQTDQRRFWNTLRAQVSSENLLEQPLDRGTATTILFALLRILRRDPLAQVLFFPAEHSFENEGAVCCFIKRAAARISAERLELMVIAVDARHPAAELSYIVPGARLQPDVYRVKDFLYQPDATLASHLHARQALWSTLLFGAWGFSVIALLREHVPGLVDALAAADSATTDRGRRLGALTELYQRLPIVDFARVVMPKARSMMQVVHARDCGWTEFAAAPRMPLPYFANRIVSSTSLANGTDR
jgi:mannose-1-phosphate guanylyltransferase